MPAGGAAAPGWRREALPRSLRQQLRRQAERSLSSPWLKPVAAMLSHAYGGVATALLYHRIVDDALPAGFAPNRSLAVPLSHFEQQMAELARRGGAVALADAAAGLLHGDLPRGTVVVTFDDGYRDNLRLALPVLERHGIPATVFIATGLIEGSAPVWWQELEAIVDAADTLTLAFAGRQHCYRLHDDVSRFQAFAELAERFKTLAGEPERQRLLMQQLRAQVRGPVEAGVELLDWHEVRRLDAHPLITIAAHTVNHPALSRLDLEQAAREMYDSKQQLEARLGHPVPFFAYPFGDAGAADQREFQLCEALGFELALTTRPGHWQPGHSRHRFALPRVFVEHDDTLDDFRFKLSGLDAFLRQRGRRFVTA